MTTNTPDPIENNVERVLVRQTATGFEQGIAAGAGGGKMVSDGLQWLFGDKKTAEQRKMEEALAALQGGRV